MEDLVILDYSTGEVHLYKVPEASKITEDYLKYLGHRECDCYYMIGENIKIIKHENT